MAEDAQAGEGSIRDAIRWGLFLATVATFGFRLAPLVRDFRQWREAVHLSDASEAVALRTHLAADAASMLIVLALGLAIFFALRQRVKNQP